jgi:hypothetical protein
MTLKNGSAGFAECRYTRSAQPMMAAHSRVSVAAGYGFKTAYLLLRATWPWTTAPVTNATRVARPLR